MNEQLIMSITKVMVTYLDLLIRLGVKETRLFMLPPGDLLYS